MIGSALIIPALLFQSAAEAPPAPPPDPEEAVPPEVDPGVLPGRRRPDFDKKLPERTEQDNPGAVCGRPAHRRLAAWTRSRTD